LNNSPSKAPSYSSHVPFFRHRPRASRHVHHEGRSTALLPLTSLQTAIPTRAGDSSGYKRYGDSPQDVVIVSALRTPLTRARRGPLKDTPADDLLAAVLSATIARTGVNPADVGDVVVGSVLGHSSQRANESRIACFLAGFPETVPVHTVNRQCSSGLQAVADVAAGIKAGYYNIGIAAGVETMSRNPMAWEGGMNPKVANVPHAASCLVPMGITSENVAEKYGISRETQDKFAAMSHAKVNKSCPPIRDQVGSRITHSVPSFDRSRSFLLFLFLLTFRPRPQPPRKPASSTPRSSPSKRTFSPARMGRPKSVSWSPQTTASAPAPARPV
jgi:hypothetical protein